ncbi:murein transglycosylase [Parafrankia colletiae]|uniref:Murein transglycosylase n=1 Tax=Parafrankia colletiae TaxID=573497 RepID=A0A1S1RAY9_9ACTN|nr:murein transglycosylase [Parafrankia colletiae]
MAGSRRTGRTGRVGSAGRAGKASRAGSTDRATSTDRAGSADRADLAGGPTARRAGTRRGSWALAKFGLGAAALALAVTAVAGPAPAAAPWQLTGPVNGRIDQDEILPEDGAAFGSATVADLAGVVGASGQVRLPVRDGLAVVATGGTAGTGTATAGAQAPGPATGSTVPNEPLATPPGSGAEASTIPSRVLVAYTDAADRLKVEQPGCFLHWSVLAGLGAIESGHGRGAAIGPDGRVAPTVVGPRLDGSAGRFHIRDTDDGWLDGDSELDRAVGPMQFTPPVWRWAGRDADGDGRADPNDIDDAALAAADLLCRSGDLRIPDNVLAAVRSYNPSEAYIRSVLGWAAWYAVGPTVVSSLGADPAAGTVDADGDAAGEGSENLATDQPFEVTALTPLADPAGGGCVTPVVDGGSISASGVGGDLLTGSDFESLDVRARVGGTADRTVTIELSLLDKAGATVATALSARTLPEGDEIHSLGRIDGLAIGRASDRGPFDVVVRVAPGGPDCPPVEARARVADIDAADFAGAPSTLASLRRRLETYRDTGRITPTAATDLLATLPAGDGAVRTPVELARFLDRLAVAIRIGEIAADARTGLGDVAGALRAQVDPASAAPAEAAPAGAGADEGGLPFDVVPLSPEA